MDKQPLNTGEQKDMTEFFTDLISKLEEMSPDMVGGGALIQTNGKESPFLLKESCYYKLLTSMVLECMAIIHICRCISVRTKITMKD